MVKDKAKQGVDALKKQLRVVALAGVGAAVLARESAAGMARKFLAKGEAYEPEIRKAIKGLMARRKKVAAAAGKFGAKAEGGLKRVMEALPLVTKGDVAGLAKRIDALYNKVDALTKKRK